MAKGTVGGGHVKSASGFKNEDANQDARRRMGAREVHSLTKKSANQRFDDTPKNFTSRHVSGKAYGDAIVKGLLMGAIFFLTFSVFYFLFKRT